MCEEITCSTFEKCTKLKELCVNGRLPKSIFLGFIMQRIGTACTLDCPIRKQLLNDLKHPEEA